MSGFLRLHFYYSIASRIVSPWSLWDCQFSNFHCLSFTKLNEKCFFFSLTFLWPSWNVWTVFWRRTICSLKRRSRFQSKRIPSSRKFYRSVITRTTSHIQKLTDISIRINLREVKNWLLFGTTELKGPRIRFCQILGNSYKMFFG